MVNLSCYISIVTVLTVGRLVQRVTVTLVRSADGPQKIYFIFFCFLFLDKRPKKQTLSDTSICLFSGVPVFSSPSVPHDTAPLNLADPG